MNSKTIHLDGVGDVTITKRRGQRSVRLTIDNEKIKVSQPSWLPFSAGETFVRGRHTWISQHLKPATVYTDGSLIGRFVIQITRSQKKKVHARVLYETLHVYLPLTKALNSLVTQQEITKAISVALRDESEKVLPQRVRQLAEHFGFSYASVQIRQLKRRWGSCNSKKELIFNLNLIQLDPLHIDYVILHELTHTVYMNHSAEFWNHLESLLPGARRIAKIVRRINV